ncbi:MAG TPA: MoaD/ThiS family protein [Actinomycetota bacterium]|nr:MoaD/ThiS family protein [Actinomycetota bacterium]
MAELEEPVRSEATHPSPDAAAAAPNTGDTVTVTLFAAARDAAGFREIELPAGSVNDVLGALLAASPPALARVLPVCSLLADGHRVSGTPTLTAGTVLHVLPPFAGG